VAAGAARKAAVVTDNKAADMVTRVTADSRVDMVSKGTVVDRDMADSKVDGANTKDMVNSVDMDNRDMVDKKVDGDSKVDRDTEVSKADGDKTKDMVNSVDMDNRSTADMASNMKVSMVQTGTMAGADTTTMKMNPACRDATRVRRKKIMKKTMMKMMTIMECRASMERKKKRIMMKTRMKMTTAR
jgi:hypothetical protein